jgi:hypothetical protein
MPNPTRTPSPTAEGPESPDIVQEQIRQRAYELYEQRGREDGHDLDDWLAAESEVTRRTKHVEA